MAKIWATIQFLQQIWNAILVFIGWIEKEKHDAEVKKINEEAGKAANPDAPEEERREATKNLEDIVNRHT